jgi:DNA polymerase III delta prime subunit
MEIITEDMFSSINYGINEQQLNWLNKYAPKDIKDCLIKAEDKKLIESWISNLINTKSENTTAATATGSSKSKGKRKDKGKSKNIDTNCLFLYGPPGIGKTTIAKIILKKYNFDILEFNASDTRTAKHIQENLTQIGGSHNVIQFMCNKKVSIGIILDEIDGLSSGDKGGMTEINNIIAINKKKKTPFICISNNVCKKTDALKRKSLFIKVAKPTDFQIKSLITKIGKSEHLNLTPQIIKKIVEKSQGDIRRCITLLEFIFRNSNNNPNISMEINESNTNKNDTNMNLDIDLDINIEDHFESIEAEINNYSRKRTELAPFEMCEKVLNSVKTLNFFIDNFNFDHSMTNWYIYENFIKYLDKNRVANIDKKIANINEFYECHVLGDIFESKVLSNQNYDIYEYINLIKTYGSSFLANYNLKKTSYNKMGMMTYSTLLNKTSLEYSNSKGWKQIRSHLYINGGTNINRDICNIFYKKLDNEDKEFILYTIKEYSLDIDIVEKMLKNSCFYKKDQPHILTDLKKKIKIYYK